MCYVYSKRDISISENLKLKVTVDFPHRVTPNQAGRLGSCLLYNYKNVLILQPLKNIMLEGNTFF